MSFGKALEKDLAILVFDEDYPQGELCSNRGSWPSLFSQEEANQFVAEFSGLNPNSLYRIFKLVEIEQVEGIK